MMSWEFIVIAGMLILIAVGTAVRIDRIERRIFKLEQRLPARGL